MEFKQDCSIIKCLRSIVIDIVPFCSIVFINVR